MLPDAALVSAALAGPRTEVDLVALPVWGGRSMRRQTADLAAGASRRRSTLPDDELPDLKTPHEGPPPARSWGDRDPAAAARLAAARAAVGALAEQHGLPGREPARAGRRTPAGLGAARRADDDGTDVAAFLRATAPGAWQVGLAARDPGRRAVTAEGTFPRSPAHRTCRRPDRRAARIAFAG